MLEGCTGAASRALYRGPVTPPAIASEHIETGSLKTSTGRGRIVAALGVVFMVVIVSGVLWLSLSTRGFSMVGDAADGARVVVRGVEGRLDTNLIDRSDLPWAEDEIAHLIGWSGLTVLVGMMCRTRRSLGDLAVGVFAASFGIEVLQALLTTSRSMEAEDISANALGVMMGLMVLVALERLLPPRHSRASAKSG